MKRYVRNALIVLMISILVLALFGGAYAAFILEDTRKMFAFGVPMALLLPLGWLYGLVEEDR